MRVSARSCGVLPISDGPGVTSSRYSQIAVISAMTVPSSSSSAGHWPVGFFARNASPRFSPLRKSTSTRGSSMPRSAMKMRTTRGLGPIELYNSMTFLLDDAADVTTAP